MKLDLEQRNKLAHVAFTRGTSFIAAETKTPIESVVAVLSDVEVDEGDGKKIDTWVRTSVTTDHLPPTR